MDMHKRLRMIQKQLRLAHQPEELLLQRIRQSISAKPFAAEVTKCKSKSTQELLDACKTEIARCEDYYRDQDRFMRDINYTPSCYGKDPRRHLYRRINARSDYRSSPASCHRGNQLPRANNPPTRHMPAPRNPPRNSKLPQRKQRANPNRPDGKPLRCYGCGSAHHFLPGCDEFDRPAKINFSKSLIHQLADAAMPDDDPIEPNADESSMDPPSAADVEEPTTDVDPSPPPHERECAGFTRYIEHNPPQERHVRYNAVCHLNSRSDLHAMLGANEMLHAQDSTFDKFHGICIDHGAQRSTAGRNQYLACLKHARTPAVKLSPANKVCRFGDALAPALGIASMRFPADDHGNFFEFDCIIVDQITRILLGLNEIYSCKMDALVSNMALSTSRWSAPIVLKHQHLFIEPLWMKRYLPHRKLRI